MSNWQAPEMTYWIIPHQVKQDRTGAGLRIMKESLPGEK